MVDLSKCRVGSKVKAHNGEIGRVIEVDKGTTDYPIYIEIEGMRLWYQNDGVLAGSYGRDEKNIVEVIKRIRKAPKKDKPMKIPVTSYDQLKTGQHVSCLINGHRMDDGIIHCEDGKVWICQDSFNGNVSPNTHGKAHSWIIKHPTEAGYKDGIYGVTELCITQDAPVTTIDYTKLPIGTKVRNGTGRIGTIAEWRSIGWDKASYPVFVQYDGIHRCAVYTADGKLYIDNHRADENLVGVVEDAPVVAKEPVIKKSRPVVKSYEWDGVTYTENGVDGVDINTIKSTFADAKLKVGRHAHLFGKGE